MSETTHFGAWAGTPLEFQGPACGAPIEPGLVIVVESGWSAPVPPGVTLRNHERPTCQKCRDLVFLGTPTETP